MIETLAGPGMSSRDVENAVLALQNQELRTQKRWPYYDLVPKEIHANLDFRERIIHSCNRRPHLRHKFWSMAKRDLLFHINAFEWIYEPRPKPMDLPFITYPFQDESLTTIRNVLGYKDLVIEKSRDMGASWMVISVLEWLWQFHGRYSFLVLSRKEDLVDATEDPDSLFWKFDFLRKKQPRWMQPPVERTKMHCLNRMFGGVIDGESTNDFAGTGGRRTAIMLDEFSKMENQAAIFTGTRDVTLSRIFVFTPQGTGNKAYDIAHDEKKFKKITLHWTKHPTKSKGLYFTNEIVGSGIRFPEGKPRSPWYDEQCSRTVHPKEIAQELDIDYLGSSYQFFNSDLMNQMRQTCCRVPIMRGDLSVDHEGKPTGFSEIGNGRLRLWTFLDDAGMPPADRTYAVGVDISTGTVSMDDSAGGASNSVAVVIDCKINEQVAEFVTSGTAATDFAIQCIGLARWFKNPAGHPAYMIWERNGGCGIAFSQQMMKSSFRHFYYQTTEDRMTGKRSEIPGYFHSRETKKANMAFLAKAWEDHSFVPRSFELLSEAEQYIYTNNGAVQHSRQATSDIPTEVGDNHGDRVIAAMLACKALKERPDSAAAEQEVENQATFAYRRRRYEERTRRAESQW